MKKVVIVLIILIGLLYLSTGRYSTVQVNIKRDGWSALLDEPFWIGGWVMERLGRAKKSTDTWIAQRRQDEGAYDAARDEARYGKK